MKSSCMIAALALTLSATIPAAAMRRIERISIGENGIEAVSTSNTPAVSADGRFVAFTSFANNLVIGDTSPADVFLRDRLTGTTTRISVTTSGEQANKSSGFAAISANGRWVAFQSEATNLAPNDTNSETDVFLHDTATGNIHLISADANGVPGSSASGGVAISADGRFAAFTSFADNLVVGDTNSVPDVFVRDLENGTTQRVSVDSFGVQGNARSDSPAISGDGRFIAFNSFATNLSSPPTSGAFHVFVHDRISQITELITVPAFGPEADGWSFRPQISDDGRFVVFRSGATNLVAGDTNGVTDIFVRDRIDGTTDRVSIGDSGEEGDQAAGLGDISLDGRYVAFASNATNLVANDTNNALDVFLRDRFSATTERVSVTDLGEEGDGSSGGLPVIAADGRVIVFASSASNLVPGDTNSVEDVLLSVSGCECGDSIADDVCAEQCDDSNTIDGDCCSATCQIEPLPCAPLGICASVPDSNLIVNPVIKRSVFRDSGRTLDGKLDRWTTRGDFNLGFGQELDPDTETVQFELIQSDGLGGTRILYDTTLAPDQCPNLTCFEPSTTSSGFDRRWRFSLRRGDTEVPGGAGWRRGLFERSLKLPDRIRFSLSGTEAMIEMPQLLGNVRRIRQSIRVGDDCITATLDCQLNRSGTRLSCDEAHCGDGVLDRRERCGEVGLGACTNGRICDTCRCIPSP